MIITKEFASIVLVILACLMLFWLVIWLYDNGVKKND